MATISRVKADNLRSFTARLCEAMGTPSDIAEVEAEILVNADLRGHTSHGVYQFPNYIRAVEDKSLIPDAVPEIVNDSPSAALVDARNGWGHYSARRAMELAIDKAEETGVGAISLASANHIGRLGEYCEQAAAAGYISFVTFGLGGRNAGVATPFGGAEAVLSSNPIAFGVPATDGRHVISDFATTMLANAKINIYRIKGQELPPGCIVDKDGRPSTDPNDFNAGGKSLVFGGYKGYAFSLLTCLLAGLNGGFDAHKCQLLGSFFLAIKVGAFMPSAAYGQNAASFLDFMRGIKPAPGFSEVLVAGDMERRKTEEQMAEGIELPEEVMNRLRDCGEEFGVDENLETVRIDS